MTRIKTLFFYRRYWHTRKDGIRQRYWHKIYYIVKIPDFFRATIAVNNVPISNRLHHFSVSKIAEIIDMEDLKEALLKYMEDEIGYERVEWWFLPVFGIEHAAPIEATAPDTYFQHRIGRKS